jgi:hypothetical protein
MPLIIITRRWVVSSKRKIWRHQRGNQKPYIGEGQTTQKPKVKGQTTIYKTLHWQLKIEQREPSKNRGKSGAPEGQAAPAQHVTHVVPLLSQTNEERTSIHFDSHDKDGSKTDDQKWIQTLRKNGHFPITPSWSDYYNNTSVGLAIINSTSWSGGQWTPHTSCVVLLKTLLCVLKYVWVVLYSVDKYTFL